MKVKYILSKPMQLWFFRSSFISLSKKGTLHNSWISQLVPAVILWWLLWQETLNESGVHHCKERLVLLMWGA